jgi:hypothetical protein
MREAEQNLPQRHPSLIEDLGCIQQNHAAHKSQDQMSIVHVFR